MGQSIRSLAASRLHCDPAFVENTSKVVRDQLDSMVYSLQTTIERGARGADALRMLCKDLRRSGNKALSTMTTLLVGMVAAGVSPLVISGWLYRIADLFAAMVPTNDPSPDAVFVEEADIEARSNGASARVAVALHTGTATVSMVQEALTLAYAERAATDRWIDVLRNALARLMGVPVVQS